MAGPIRIMGRDPHGAPALPQVSLSVMPTTTVYEFEGAGVHVTLTFLTPLLPHESGCDEPSTDVSHLAGEIDRWSDAFSAAF